MAVGITMLAAGGAGKPMEAHCPCGYSQETAIEGRPKLLTVKTEGLQIRYLYLCLDS